MKIGKERINTQKAGDISMLTQRFAAILQGNLAAAGGGRSRLCGPCFMAVNARKWSTSRI
jgi:hypothetical protein